MSRGKIVALIAALALLIVVISFADACHETNEPPPGGPAAMLYPAPAHQRPA